MSQQIYALNLMPIDVQSAPGELLYAEIAFEHADPNQPLSVGLASAEDLDSLGIHHQPPGHLSFFVRQSTHDSGVITITSSRPVIDPQLNVVVKIQHGAATRLQHIQTRLAHLQSHKAPIQEKSLVPVKVMREEEIQLNLAVTTPTQVVTAPLPTPERALQVSNTPPPLLQGTALSAQVSTAETKTTAPIQVAVPKPLTPIHEQILIVQKVAPPALDNTTAATLNAQPASASQAESAHITAVTALTTTTSKQHIVQTNESLWSISTEIAKQHQLPIATVMQEIKASNPQAFIGGDINKLRRGATLNFNLDATLVRQDKIASKDLPTVASKQSGKAKYRLNEAQMSLVAEKHADSAQGSAKKSTQSAKSSEQLALKVMTAREKSVKLQRNVTQLDQTLKQKDHRIQLLNTRLAQLQQQLKAQQVQKK